MSKWLVLPLVVLPFFAVAASGAAPRDRDRDRLPDRWEKRYHLSVLKKSGRRDPDRDGLRNRREYRLRTHPRRKDTDRDGLRDRAEVRRYRTNPRRKDTDGDGYGDGVEVRAGTNPRKPGSHPPGSPTLPTPPTPPGPTALPDASNTGVPPSTTLTEVTADPYQITQAGAVISGRDFLGHVEVHAPNVTIRDSRFRDQTAAESNGWWQLRNYSTGLVVEDSEFIGVEPCHNGIGNNNLTVRRSEFTGCENGMNVLGDNILFEDNWVHDLETVVAHPESPFDEPHTDGIQMASGSDNITVRHNRISPQDAGTPASTSAIIMYTGTGTPQSNVRIEGNFLDGSRASYALYAPRRQSSNIFISRNRMLRGYGYTACVRLGVTVTEFGENRDAGTDALISPDNGADGGCSN